MNRIDVGKQFHSYLVNRDEKQRDGKHSGEEFRKKFLASLDNEECWKDSNPVVVLDFSQVKRLAPSWANEVFAFFTKYEKPGLILKKIKLDNVSRVKETIIRLEIDAGYYHTK